MHCYLLQMPCYVSLMPKNLLASFQPEGHLQQLVFTVCSAVGFFCEVNVQSLCVLSVVVICCSKELDGVQIVVE